MNTRNDWQNLLKYANEDLAKYGYSLILKETDGCYDCQIVKGGVVVETYAENYYENELTDLINDAWHEVKTKYSNTEYEHTYEVCPYCEEEVELKADLSVQTCPHCGRRIVACSMCRACDANDGKNYCSNCCLCYQAERENEELGYDPKPLEDEEEETFLGGKKWSELSEHDKGVVADLEC